MFQLQFACRILLAVAIAVQVAPTPGTEDLSAVFDRADLVCECSVASATPPAGRNKSGSVRRGVVVVKVSQVYKSTGTTPSEVSVQTEENELTDGTTYLLFLKLGLSSQYTLADQSIGATPFSRLPAVANEEGVANLELTLADAADGTNRDDRIHAMRLLQGFNTLSTASLTKLLATSGSDDPEVALAAFAVLLKTGEAEYVVRLQKYLGSHPLRETPVSILSIGSELGQVRDEKALSALAKLSQSALVSVRIGTMQALRAIKSRRTTPTVIRQLDNSDAYVRYLAVMTLAETFGRYGDYAPNMALFDGNESYYIGLWKTWWLTEGKAYESLPETK